MSIKRKKDDLDILFNSLESWEEKYLLLIDLAKKLPAFSESFKVEANRVVGCTSRVWLVGQLNASGRLVFQANSDSQVVKGLAAILVELYSQETPQAILQDTSNLVEELGLTGGLMPTRVVGFEGMHKKIRQIALAYQK